ncbi:hypothetical protein N5D61_09195 [Pseudomonas sp. GD03842]|uniref:hypothetical protein n=1 Tax=Pseudomonas sp. GD03842 TaxID=2975385 RepID=UPI00244B4DF2|nr:hypothetical protein [Pseudomonas sp. GD03842]MDH0746519.1 hypothetical protein [Pseudomonas sp. GD03842]
MIQGMGAVSEMPVIFIVGKKAVPDGDALNTLSSSRERADKANFSLLARQLGESALRSNKREQELTRDELAAYAKKQINDFALDGYSFGKHRHDQELPDTDDPEHLARARQATDYVNQAASGNRYAQNPFAGLSRDQLALIAYDDSGGYTINERHAAWSESHRLKSEWAEGAVTRAQLESAQTGRIPVFLTEVLSFYRALPKIEQVQDCYPGDYEAELLEKIRVELSRPNDEAPELAKRGLNLYDILASIAMPEKKEAEAKREQSVKQHSVQASAPSSVSDKPTVVSDTDSASTSKTNN